MFVFFDSETTALGNMSFPYLYTYLVTDDSLSEVERGSVRSCEAIVEVFKRVARDSPRFPICYAYNLFFDLAPLMEMLNDEGYDFRFFAKSSRDWVSVSLLKGNREALRFVDLSFLQAGGLKLCGELAGVPKLSGEDFNYRLLRSPETELTDDEMAYAYRDVEIMPRFLETLSSIYYVPIEEFGRSICTVSQLARFNADRFFRNVKRGRRGKSVKTLQFGLVQQESPEAEEVMLLRRACFRGGYMFNSAKYVCQELNNVDIYDITSAYHFYIQSMRVPVGFKQMKPSTFNRIMRQLCDVDPFAVATSANPFPCFVHCKVRFTNLRLREPFKSMHVGTLSKSKFAVSTEYDETMDATLRVKERNMSKCRDKVTGGVWFAEKLVRAVQADVHVSEAELWAMLQVYEWDSVKFLGGEYTEVSSPPPDYQTGRSLLLYETKKIYKQVIVEGDLTDFDKLPFSVQAFIESGPDQEALRVLYQGVKIQMNTLFGELIRERNTPDWFYCGWQGSYQDIFTGDVPEWDGKEYGLYTQGLRVAGYQRDCLIALIVLADSMGVECVYGDTDSLHVLDKQGDFKDLIETRNECIALANAAAVSSFDSKTGILFDNAGVGEMVLEKHMERYVYGRMKTWTGVDTNGGFHIRQSGINTARLARFVAADYETYKLTDLVGWNVVYDKRVASKVARQCDGIGDLTEVSFEDYKGDSFNGNVRKAVHLEDQEITAGLYSTYRNDIEYLNGIGNMQDIRVKYIDKDRVYYFDYEISEEEYADS